MKRVNYKPCSARAVQRRDGFGLVESVIAMAVLLLLVTGTVGYSSYSARQVYQAQAEETAGRLALLLLEGWKGSADPDYYNPVEQFSDDLEISRVYFSFQTAGLFMALSWSSHLLGVYQVETPQGLYFLALSWDPQTASRPRQFQVQMIWRSDLRQATYWGSWESFGLTTYARS